MQEAAGIDSKDEGIPPKISRSAVKKAADRPFHHPGPAKTVGDPMDVGMCAAFLCSDAARYISGSCIPVDGGALIGF